MYDTTLFCDDNNCMCTCKDADSFVDEKWKKKSEECKKNTDKNLLKNVSQGCKL